MNFVPATVVPHFYINRSVVSCCKMDVDDSNWTRRIFTLSAEVSTFVALVSTISNCSRTSVFSFLSTHPDIVLWLADLLCSINLIDLVLWEGSTGFLSAQDLQSMSGRILTGLSLKNMEIFYLEYLFCLPPLCFFLQESVSLNTIHSSVLPA